MGDEPSGPEDDSGGETFGLRRSDASKRKRNSAVGREPFGSASAPVDNRPYLASHKAEREKDAEVRELLRNGIKQNRFCKALDNEDVDNIIEAMEYFSFDAGEHVVVQGHVGHYFFVTHDGSFEVDINGRIANEFSTGTAFGAIALLYACPRTATVRAKTAGTVWGADAVTFRKILMASAQAHYEENRNFLDCITLFDGLDDVQKERVGKLALFVETFPAGERIMSEGEIATAIYFVKKGELSVYVGGSFSACGVFEGGEKISQLKAGDPFGERGVLYNESRTSTIIADTHAELLCIGARQLNMVLGENVAACLEKSFIMSTLRKLPMVSHLSLTQQSEIARAIELKTCAPGEPVQAPGQEGMQLAIVIDGDISGSTDGVVTTVKRGGWCGDDAFSTTREEPERQGSKRDKFLSTDGLEGSGCSTIESMAAGPQGAKLALLSTEALVKSLKVLGLSAIGGSSEALDYMRQVLCAKKVPIFRGLSPEQISSFVSSFVCKRYNTGGVVINQGDIGTEFFIISKGMVSVTVNGRAVRSLGKNSCFGERALLFDEPRSASIEVTEDNTELWCISKAAFDEVISENMRHELEYKIKLQDTTVSMKLITHVRLIGAGSFGSVRLVEHKFTRLRYALKRIKKIDGEVPAAVAQECELLGLMDHPFILQLVKTFHTDSSIYILSELITGGQLHEQLGKMGVLTRKQAQFYVGSLVLILEYMHDLQIVYRDLKPENLMLDPQGYLKLVDFGLAKKLEGGQTYTLAGTLFYMAPEVIEGHGYAISVDIWSLGVMFYEFVCGCMPFGDGVDNDGDILAAVMSDDLVFPSKYNDSAGMKLVQGLLNRDPVNRLGAGIDGFSQIKKHKYFKVGVSGDLFMKILGRELDAPVVPGGDEQYSDLTTLEATISLSDAEELGGDD